MAALIPALIKLLMSRRGGGGGGGGYSRGGYSGGGGGKSDRNNIMYYTNLEALKELEDLGGWDRQLQSQRDAAAKAKAAAVQGLLQDTELPSPGGR